MKEILFNDLPRYINWIKHTLSRRDFAIKYKTEEEVIREYDNEKWGGLLEKVKKSLNPSLEEVEIESNSFDQVSPFFIRGKFYLGLGEEIADAHLELYRKTISPYINQASCLVELGAGFGSKILNLSQFNEFNELPLYAAEYTKNGCELISILSKTINKKVGIGQCDFRKLEISGIEIPKNAIIFTSYSVHYVPHLSNDFIKFLSNLNPLVVIHFEPCYEHYSVKTLHGLLCRRYIESNDYNRNIISVIDSAKNDKKISVKMKNNIIGSNPFLPISVIEWIIEQ